MEKRTLLSVVLLAVLGLGAFAVLRSPEKGVRRGPAARPLPVLKLEELTKLEVTTQKDDKTTLEKKGDQWRVTAPSDWPADPQVMKILTDGITKMSFGDVVTESTAKHADLGVADKGSTHIKITATTGTWELLMGQTVGGFTMVRLAGKDEVWQANNLFSYQANKIPKDWRAHAIFDFNATDSEKLRVEVPGGSTIALERVVAAAAEGDAKKAPATTWKVTSSTGDAAEATDVLDQSQPGTVAQAMQTLHATDFADGKSPKDAGLEPPILIVSLDAKGKTSTLEIGATQNDDVFVRKAGDPTIYMVKKYTLDRLLYRPIDYRDKTLLHESADAIAKLHVVQGKDDTLLNNKDGKWSLPSGAVDQQKVTALLGGTESLIGSGFVTDKTLKTELDKPRATITVERKAGGKAVLKVGGLSKDQGEYYVMREGSKDVLTAKKFAIDRLLKKPADLAPSAAPAGPPGGAHGLPPGMKLPHH